MLKTCVVPLYEDVCSLLIPCLREPVLHCCVLKTWGVSWWFLSGSTVRCLSGCHCYQFPENEAKTGLTRSSDRAAIQEEPATPFMDNQGSPWETQGHLPSLLFLCVVAAIGLSACPLSTVSSQSQQQKATLHML